MLPDRVSNPGPLTYESGAPPIALHNRFALKLGQIFTRSKKQNFSVIIYLNSKKE